MTGMRVELRYQAMPQPARPMGVWVWRSLEWSGIAGVAKGQLAVVSHL